jgi:hypothetical protein
MNALLKAILKEAADLFALGEAVIAKKSFAIILPTLIQAGSDASAISGNIGDLQNELKALIFNPSADADLLAYATTLIPGESAKAQALVAAAAKLALDVATDVTNLVAAFNLPSSSTTTPA